MNEKTQAKIEGLAHDLQKKCFEFLKLADAYLASIPMWRDCVCEVTEGKRTFEYQAGLFSQGRKFNQFTCKWEVISPEKIVTHTIDKSLHLNGEAFDIALFKPPGSYLWPDPKIEENKRLWMDLAAIGESLGLYPGAKWNKPDYSHFGLHKE